MAEEVGGDACVDVSFFGKNSLFDLDIADLDFL